MTNSMLRHRIPIYFLFRVIHSYSGHMYGYNFLMDDYGNAVEMKIIPYGFGYNEDKNISYWETEA